MQYLGRVVLDDHFVHEHAAAPDAAAGRQLRFEDGDLKTFLGQIISGHQAGGSGARDGHVEGHVVLQLLEKTLYYSSGNSLFHYFFLHIDSSLFFL